MDRKVARGARPNKNVPLPGNLITLGNKSAGRSDIEKSSGYSIGKNGGGSSERSRDIAGPSGLHGSKPVKPGAYIVGLGRPSGLAKPSLADTVNILSEEWETVAEEVDSSELCLFVDVAESSEEYERTEALICGSIKQLKLQRAKPDIPHCFHLLVLARLKPSMFSRSVYVTEALCSLLKRDHSMAFKTKTNPNLAVMAANILLIAYQEDKNWPEIFIKAYIDDSLGERVWVDMEECKGFVDNIITAFRTKMPLKTVLFPDLALSSRPDCPSPPISSTSSGGGESGDGDSEMSLECKESLDVLVCNRFAGITARVDEMVRDNIQHQLALRHQNVDSVARNFIRFLTSVAGIMEVRKIVASKLEAWLQSPKLQRPATELLMSVCMNCNTHCNTDIETIGHILKFRIKHKPLLNQYMACLKELLGAHPDNIQTSIKQTIYNELANSRNPSNMSILSVIFQYAPEHSAITLADEFQELFCNKDDFHRALRFLFREIVRGLRYDMQFQKFCQGLMGERKESVRENLEICERMFYGVTDIIAMVMFVAISPVVRENATLMFRGEHRDVDCVRRYQDLVANIQQDAMHWMHRVVPKMYGPGKDEYVRALHKLLMMELPDSYAIKDSYPPENDRPLFYKLASEVPLKQDTLMSLLMIAVTKDQWVKPQDLIELADKLIKRATSLQMEDVEVFHVDEIKIVDLIFNLSVYVPPENAQLPHGYRPPKMAITASYWKAWTMLLLVTAHNPGVFGRAAWENYPTLRMIMEICITNSFVFPPPTLLGVGEKAEDMINQEHILVAKDKEVIIELEEFLAQKSITEQNSLLVSQTMSMDPTGPARRPPPAVMEQLKSLNMTHRIGHLLCRSRNPDFLLDIITRQGTSQSMPWLAELVQSHENAFAMLPVQCLCEFLLSEAGGGDTTHKHQQLLHHLRALLRAPPQADASSGLEILEYFLRRLSWQEAMARCQAIRGLQRLLHPSGAVSESELESSDQHTWLLQHLTALPSFRQVRSVANQAVRAAIQVETEPSIVSAYLRFLAVHTNDDSVQEQTGLVSDLAQVIVERNTICNAMLPLPDRPSHFLHAHSTLKAFFIIFINYMRVVKVPASRETFSWSDSQDQVRVQWSNGEQAILHILVIHAIVILLTFGPSSCADLFHELMAVWFPEHLPQAFLVDTSEEALLFPDWLKLRMIRSTVPRLVDAAVKDLEPSQLVLFIQSFGIPVASMTRLLSALDTAVACNLPALQDAVQDKSHKAYMSQLLGVQHSRGAVGGLAFAEVLGGARVDDAPRGGVYRRLRAPPMLQPVQVYPVSTLDISVGEMRSFVVQCFTADPHHRHIGPSPAEMSETMLAVQRHISRELSIVAPVPSAAPAVGHRPYSSEAFGAAARRPYLTELLDAFLHCLQHRSSCSVFLAGLHRQYSLSAPLFRLLLRLPRHRDLHHSRPCTAIVATILSLDHAGVYASSPLTAILKLFPGAMQQLQAPPPPPQFESLSSPFSIANLSASAATSSSVALSSSLTAVTVSSGAPPCSVGSSMVLASSSSSSGLPLLSTSSSSKGITSIGLYRHSELSDEDSIVRSILKTPPHALERHFRGLVETAAAGDGCGMSVIRAALTRLLMMTSSSQAAIKTEEGPAPPVLQRRCVALLLDWLQVMDPELQESPEQMRKMLLFAKFSDQAVGIGVGGFSQAYLLGAFTQQANWDTLEVTVRSLLERYDPTLNAGGVLDFVWAVQRVPKLWQGRERRTPRHATPPVLMHLQDRHLHILAEYIIGESCEYNKEAPVSNFNNNGEGSSTVTASSFTVTGNTANISSDKGNIINENATTTGSNQPPDRLPLLLQWYGDNDALYSALIQRLSLASVSPVDSPERRANRTFLYQLYLRRPCVLTFITADVRKILPAIAARSSVETGDGESSADVAIHCLLTMLCSPEEPDEGRDCRVHLHELEAALRTLIGRHPLLLLRHFHLLYTGLDGLGHLHLQVLKENNHVKVLLIVTGLLELLHPHLFSPHHNKALRATLDCYINIFGQHGAPSELASVTSGIIAILHAWLATDRSRALAYLVPKTELLKSLSHQEKEWRLLAVAASSAPTFPTESPIEDVTLTAPSFPQPNEAWFKKADAICGQLSGASTSDQRLDAYRQLSHLASRTSAEMLVRRFLPALCSGVHSSEHYVRTVSWELLSKALMHDPTRGEQLVPTVLTALQSGDYAVVSAACDHLPDVAIMLHPWAPDVLTAAFVAVTTKVPNSLSALTRAMTMLNLHTGA